MRQNTLYVEIEQKYKADHMNWDKFVQLVCSMGPVKQLRILGPDTYYLLGKEVLRWRFSKEKSELTVKNRCSSKSTFVRKEVDLNIEENSPKTIIAFLKVLKCKKLFRIYKDCHIFWFDRKEGKVSIVIYDVKCKGKKRKRFIEIEADKGQNYDASKKLVRIWEKRLKLKIWQRINRSLYEIYSGKIMRVENLRRSL